MVEQFRRKGRNGKADVADLIEANKSNDEKITTMKKQGPSMEANEEIGLRWSSFMLFYTLPRVPSSLSYFLTGHGPI